MIQILVLSSSKICILIVLKPNSPKKSPHHPKTYKIQENVEKSKLLKIWEAQIFQPRLPGVLDARAIHCWCCYAALRSSDLKIVMADVKMKFAENILELLISEFVHEDIEKVGDAGKEDGREALGKVIDKIDIIVNVYI